MLSHECVTFFNGIAEYQVSTYSSLIQIFKWFTKHSKFCIGGTSYTALQSECIFSFLQILTSIIIIVRQVKRCQFPVCKMLF